MSQTPHSVLIVGCGSIGERHLRCFQQTGRAQVAACDANPALLQRVAETYKVPTFAQFEQALAGPYEAVVIATPAHLHVPLALQALRKGRHVLIEKPLSQSLQGVAELIAERDRSGRRAFVAYVYHMHVFLRQARDFLRQGELGPVRHAVSTSGQNFPKLRPAYAVPYSKTYYADRKTGGGAIQDALTHIVNWVESVVGPTQSVLCDCAHQVVADVTVEDTVNVSARNGDALVSYALNQFQAPNESYLQFNAAKGSVRIEFHHQRWGVLRDGEREWTWHTQPKAEWDTPFLAQANAFLDEIEGRPGALCTLEAAAQTLRFNLAALASADANARVACSSLHA